MKRSALFSLSLGLVGVLSIASLRPGEAQASAGTAQAAQACPNFIPVEPIVNYDVTGSTLLGPFHYRYTVYSTGFVTLSRQSATPLFEGEIAPLGFGATTLSVPKEDVDQLKKDLRAAGAFQLCDQNLFVADIPMTTVTVFAGGTNSLAHTFSYWTGSGSYESVQEVLGEFQAAHFPNF